MPRLLGHRMRKTLHTTSYWSNRHQLQQPHKGPTPQPRSYCLHATKLVKNQAVTSSQIRNKNHTATTPTDISVISNNSHAL